MAERIIKGVLIFYCGLVCGVVGMAIGRYTPATCIQPTAIAEPSPVVVKPITNNIQKQLDLLTQHTEILKQHVQALEAENEEIKQFINNLFTSFGINSDSNVPRDKEI